MNFSRRTQHSRRNQFFSADNYCNFLQGLNISMHTKVDGMKLHISSDLLSPEYWAVAIPHLKPSKAGLYFVG